MARKTSIYVDAGVQSIVAAREMEKKATTRRHGRRSSMFREVIRRCDQVCQRDLPEGLASAEWQTLIEAGGAWADSTDINGDLRLASLFTAASGTVRLLRKLIALSPGKRVALIDNIERYWAGQAQKSALPELPGQQSKPSPPQPRAAARR